MTDTLVKRLIARLSAAIKNWADSNEVNLTNLWFEIIRVDSSQIQSDGKEYTVDNLEVSCSLTMQSTDVD